MFFCYSLSPLKCAVNTLHMHNIGGINAFGSPGVNIFSYSSNKDQSTLSIEGGLYLSNKLSVITSVFL